ncbi:MAG: hypothetical protein AMS22_00885 [Thiotrichales bacterium SG8_50]|jgi:CMP-N,N'-diacetyllegionaminic acid synthase|nr:MAG: hypothetical protein AMS22_00885 [Thiotrichales bacterium SG8_50]
MAIIGLVPARGGSKGIPGKNLVACGGQPLISHSIVAARDAARIDRVVVSTDDPGIADVARQWGAEVPFLRPERLSSDDAPMLGVVQHALEWLMSEGSNVDALVLLQPTSPLRRGCHIDAAVELFFRTKATSVVSVVEVPHRFHPISVLISDNGLLRPYLPHAPAVARRQDKPPVYARNGPAILVCAPATLISGSLYGDRCVAFPMSHRESVDVDDMEDLALADWLMQRQSS